MSAYVTQRQKHLWTLVLLGFVTVAGGALRFIDISHSLWLDELHTAWCVTDSWSEIVPRARLGNYSPLYFAAMWMVVQAFGTAEWALRLPSLVAGIALVPAIYVVTVRLCGSRLGGLAAASIVAFDGALFGWYAQEARPYAIIQLLAVCHVGVFWEIECQPNAALRRRWRCLLVLLTAILFYLHYTALLLLVGEAAWYAYARFRRSRRATAQYAGSELLLDGAISAAICWPAVGHLAEIFSRRQNWAQFVAPPTGMELAALFTMAPWALAVFGVTAGIAVLMRRHSHDAGMADNDTERTESIPLALPLCWYLAPVALAAALTYSDIARLCFARYLLASAVALPVLAGFAVSIARRRHLAWGLIASALVLVSLPRVADGGPSCLAITRLLQRQPVAFTGHFSEDWRRAIQFVDRHAQPRDALFLWAGLIESPLPGISAATDKPDRDFPGDEELRRYLLFPLAGPYALGDRPLLDDPERLRPLVLSDDSILTAAETRAVQTHGTGWFVVRSPASIYPDDPRPVEVLSRDLLDALRAHGIRGRVVRRQSFRGLAVVQIELAVR